MKSLFGKLKKDGTFDRRFKGNKHGWAGKLPIDSAVVGAYEIGSKAKKAVGKAVFDTFVNETTVEMVQDWSSDVLKNRPNKEIDKKIESLPPNISYEEKFKELVNFTNTNYLNKPIGSLFKPYFEKIDDDTVKILETLFFSLDDSFWITNYFIPKGTFKNYKTNNQLKRKIAEYYNDKVDEKFIQIRTILGDENNLEITKSISPITGESNIKRFNRYEKARFEFYFYNTPLKNKPGVLINRLRGLI